MCEVVWQPCETDRREVEKCCSPASTAAEANSALDVFKEQRERLQTRKKRAAESSADVCLDKRFKEEGFHLVSFSNLL